METQIQAYLRTPMGMEKLLLFGYATKGLAGLEIHGLGKYSKNTREKFLYLSKRRELQIPFRRYSLCVDLNQQKKDWDWDVLKWLEFPLLLCFWHLAEQLPIMKLDNCMANGMVMVDGTIIHQNERPPERWLHEKRLIIKSNNSGPTCLSSHHLLEHIPELQFETILDRKSAS